MIDEGIAILFKAPASFTGENMLELYAHGSPVVLDRLVERIAALGARPAGPGEFSRRAFENGKYDLAQLEAIADLIAGAGDAAARSAQRSLQGEFSKQVHGLCEALANCVPEPKPRWIFQTRILICYPAGKWRRPSARCPCAWRICIGARGAARDCEPAPKS